VTVDPDRGVEVVLPRRSPEGQAARVVEELGPWIERRLAAQARAREAVHGPAGTVPYLGEALTLVPEPVLDYVVIHEACHLKVADHSRGFWSLVERHCPDWREHTRWLRRNGSALTL
jgi:predicted metal-dependent hydrolase